MKKRTMKILATVMCFVTVFCMAQVFAGAAYIENATGVEEDEVLVIDVTDDEFPITAEEEPVEMETQAEVYRPANPQKGRTITLAEILEAIFGKLLAM